MGKGGGGSMPKYPDPMEVARAQTNLNKETAYWNALLNNVNQNTPYGSVSFNNPGYDPKNQQPFTSTITLSPEQQQIYDTQTASDIALGNLGEQQISKIADSVAQPFSFSGIPDLYGTDDLDAARLRTEEALYSRLNPQFKRDEEALRTRLVNQGIGHGSEAYMREMERFNQAKNDARMGAVLAGGAEADRLFGQSMASRQQGINEYMAERNAPLNEYIGMTSGVQVTNPQFQNYSYAGAQPGDYQGAVNAKYQSDIAAHNAKQASKSSALGGLFKLGGTFLGML